MRPTRIGMVAGLALLAGCSGAKKDDPLVDLHLAPDASVHSRTSYAYRQAHSRCVARGSTGLSSYGFLLAFGWLDLDGDGIDDQLAAPGGNATNPLQARLAGGDGSWSDGSAVFSGPGAEGIHPRKLLVGDLNADGWPDAVVLDHGDDAPPWPGAPVRILLSDGAGHLTTTVRDDLVGYHHGGALGDIDDDGDLDLVVMDNPGLRGPHRVLLNDGAGNFTVATGRFESDAAIFTAELFDLDGDGYLDLAVGGHEFEGTPLRVHWGSSRGTYSTALGTDLPAVPGYGVVLDLAAEDVDGDGHRDLVVLRTGGGPDGPGFYSGRAIQILVSQGDRTFVDESAARLADATAPAEPWIDWISVLDRDGDGHVDLCADVAGSVLGWDNDGTGHFVRR